MEKEDLIQPKMLYCGTCNTFSKPDYRLTCGVCGETLKTCWWALLRRRSDAKYLCDDCRNRFWCWTTTPIDGRIPSITQARIVQDKRTYA